MNVKRVVTIAGYLAFGFLAAMGAIAVILTAMQLGIWPTLTQAVPAASPVFLPLLMWWRYTTHPPTRRRGAVAWILAWSLLIGALMVSPVWFWTAPILAVLAAEAARCRAGRGHARKRAALHSSETGASRSTTVGAD